MINSFVIWTKWLFVWVAAEGAAPNLFLLPVQENQSVFRDWLSLALALCLTEVISLKKKSLWRQTRILFILCVHHANNAENKLAYYPDFVAQYHHNYAPYTVFC